MSNVHLGHLLGDVIHAHRDSCLERVEGGVEQCLALFVLVNRNPGERSHDSIIQLLVHYHITPALCYSIVELPRTYTNQVS